MKNRVPSFGVSVFPSPTGGPGRARRIGVTPFVRCMQCGFVNDSRKIAWSRKGEGEEGKSGCAFCASLYWASQKPAKIRDDRFKADPTVTKRR